MQPKTADKTQALAVAESLRLMVLFDLSGNHRANVSLRISPAALPFVSLMHATHAARRAPEFVVMAGAISSTVNSAARGGCGRQGEVLFHQNDRSDELFLIHSGMLDISVGNGVRGEETIASIGAGSFVGERSLMTGEPRSATVRAAGDAILFVVPKAAMGELLRDHPGLAEQIAQVMAQQNEEAISAKDANRQFD